MDAIKNIIEKASKLKDTTQLGGILHGPYQQGTVAGLYTLCIGARRPVQELAAPQLFCSVLVYALVNLANMPY